MTKTRCAIVGTAPSWREAPWDDPDLYIVSLNDAYVMGLPRVDEWCELHPLDHLWFRDPRQKMVDPRQVPPGHYIRPHGHVEWLRQTARTLPVWLQSAPPADWPPNAQRLPVEALEAKYGTYWASGPAYMLLHLYERGFREFQIYGIHLSTQEEYIHQRPNFEFLLGRLLGPAVQITVRDGKRIYDGETGVRVVLPASTPILQHGWKYAYEPKPAKPVDPFADEWAAVQQEKRELTRALIAWPTGKDRTAALARLQRLEVIEMDIQQQRARRQGCGTLAAKLVAA